MSDEDICKCGHARIEHGVDGVCEGSNEDGTDDCGCEEFTWPEPEDA